MTVSIGRQRLVVDVALLLAVAAALAALHFLVPQPIQSALYFRHDLSEPWTLFTSAYFHANDGHLFRNVVGYLLAASYTYALCIGADERRWFHYTFAALLLILPVLVNLTSYIVFAVQYPTVEVAGKGFSGAVGGLTGFLLVALYAYMRAQYSARVGHSVALSAFLVLMLLVDIRYAGGVRPVVAGLIAAGIALMVGGIVVEGDVWTPQRSEWRSVGADVGAVVLVFAVLAVLVLELIPDPSSIVEGGSMTNVFAHAAGFLFGIGVSVTTVVSAGLFESLN